MALNDGFTIFPFVAGAFTGLAELCGEDSGKVRGHMLSDENRDMLQMAFELSKKRYQRLWSAGRRSNGQRLYSSLVEGGFEWQM